MAEKIQLSKKDRLSVAWRHQFLQGSWNYERMQNGGWCYSIIPAIKKLYKDPQDRADALKRHLEFYNTHPYVSAPVMGVTLALEEERANGAEINDQAIQGVKVGMMEFDLLGYRLLIAQPLHQDLHRELADLFGRLRDTGDGRMQEIQKQVVVERQDRNVVRDSQRRFPDRPDRPEHNGIAQREDRGGPGG